MTDNNRFDFVSKIKTKGATAKAESDPKKTKERTKPLAKYKNPDYEKGTYYLPKTLTHQMRIHAATHQIEMSELVKKALESYFKGFENDENP